MALLRQYLTASKELVIELIILLVNPMFGMFAGLGYITQVCPLLFTSVECKHVSRWSSVTSILVVKWPWSLLILLWAPSPAVDCIRDMIFVWQLRGEIIRTVLCRVVYNSCEPTNILAVFTVDRSFSFRFCFLYVLFSPGLCSFVL